MTIMIPAWVEGTLTPVEKLEAHVRGLRHKAISVFVRRGDALLLQRRALGKYHTPGLWANTCCTHPDWDETALACAHRRVAEEMGLTGLDLRHVGQVEYRADVGNGLVEHEVVEMFLADVPAGVEPVPNPDEVMEARWARLSEIEAEIARDPDAFTPWLRIYLGAHAGMIFGEMA